MAIARDLGGDVRCGLQLLNGGVFRAVDGRPWVVCHARQLSGGSGHAAFALLAPAVVALIRRFCECLVFVRRATPIHVANAVLRRAQFPAQDVPATGIVPQHRVGVLHGHTIPQGRRGSRLASLEDPSERSCFLTTNVVQQSE